MLIVVPWLFQQQVIVLPVQEQPYAQHAKQDGKYHQVMRVKQTHVQHQLVPDAIHVVELVIKNVLLA